MIKTYHNQDWRSKIFCSYNDVYLDMAVVEPNLEVKNFDEILDDKMDGVHSLDIKANEWLERLTEMFENRSSRDDTDIASVSEGLKLVNVKSNERIYILDPNKSSLDPIIYIIDGNGLLYG